MGIMTSIKWAITTGKYTLIVTELISGTSVPYALFQNKMAINLLYSLSGLNLFNIWTFDWTEMSEISPDSENK